MLSVNVRVERARKGWSQERLAEVSGASIGTVRGIESGKTTSPQLHTLVALAKAFDVDLAVLLSFADSTGEHPSSET